MSKRELLEAIKPRYIKASKKEKTAMLNEFCKNTRYNRDYAVRILQAGYDHNRVKRIGRKGRKNKYSHDLMAVVVKVWELLEYPCGQRLQPNLMPTVAALVRHGELQINEKMLKLIKTISAKTLDRRLKRERENRHLSRNRGTTRHGVLLKSSIPIRITSWNLDEVGNLETDTVAHNGGDPSGEYIYSLDLVEIYSGWSEQQAVMVGGEFHFSILYYALTFLIILTIPLSASTSIKSPVSNNCVAFFVPVIHGFFISREIIAA